MCCCKRLVAAVVVLMVHLALPTFVRVTIWMTAATLMAASAFVWWSRKSVRIVKSPA